MQDPFPGSLATCIRDGRLPLPEEVANVSAKLWQEGLVHCMPTRPDVARVLAEVALCGRPIMLETSDQCQDRDWKTLALLLCGGRLPART